ncbi:MAG: peptidoglycan editing factor PgeF, partial [Planctomycetota bacterium]
TQYLPAWASTTMKLVIRQGLKFFQFNHLLKFPKLQHYITTRSGGGDHSLNLGFHIGDKPAGVLANRRRLSRALGISLKNLTVGQQAHGSRVKIVSPEDIGRGASENRTAIRNIDALITQQPRAVLLTLSADCPLILCADPVRKVIANIHAGWRSLAGGIIKKTIERMVHRFGCRPADILAGVSPSIGPCCYEVQDDFIKSLKLKNPEANRYLIKRWPRYNRGGAKKYFNLPGLVKRRLETAGLKSKYIQMAGLCTKCHPELFYSYRRDGPGAGRFGALIWYD